jgi:predicted Fe-Mo cluster-binding NifX family protein
MIISLCAKGPELTSEVDPRFGRCEYFLFYNSDDGSCTALANSARNAAGGAGVMACQIVGDNGTGVVIAPELGPQAMGALSRMGIPVFAQGEYRTAEEALEAWKNHRLEEMKKVESTGLRRV